MGTIYCGDNLEVLNEYIPRESIDLIYLDPPFNSQRTFNLVYKDQRAQEEAFKDFWSWEEAAPTFHKIMESGNIPKATRTLLKALHDVLIDTDSDQLAYLTMMTPRLVALHRALKKSGTLYLHCDSTASHYLKAILDSIFEPQNFRSETIWKRTFAHGDPHRTFGVVTDTILIFTKSDEYAFEPQYRPFDKKYIAKRINGTDPDGRTWQSVTLRSPSPRPNLHYDYKASNGVTYRPHPNGWSCDPEQMKRYDRDKRLHFPKKANGKLRLKMYWDEPRKTQLSSGSEPELKVQNLWDDIPPINSQAKERLGYPTQKPLALMERIIKASSKPGDLVLDPFCGCGTTVEAAERLGRRWIGIDIARKAIEVIEHRFKKVGLEAPDVVWHPADPQSADALAKRDKNGFEKWALRKVRAARLRKKDRGIDGEAFFKESDGTVRNVVVSVKGGVHLPPTFARDLRGVIEREKAMGVLVSLVEPGKEMKLEAARAGYLNESDAEGPIPRLQLVTVERLFSELPPIRCPGENVTEMPKPSVPPGRPDAQLTLNLSGGSLKPPKVPRIKGPTKAQPQTQVETEAPKSSRGSSAG